MKGEKGRTERRIADGIVEHARRLELDGSLGLGSDEDDDGLWVRDRGRSQRARREEEKEQRKESKANLL